SGTGRRGGVESPIKAAVQRGAIFVTGAVNPWSAIDRATRVYTAGGEIGFLALLAGRPVRAFAPAFYTGWGVTEDEPALPQRAFARTIDEIFAGACLIATRYLDPFRHKPASFEDTLALLADWRRIDEANRRIAVCVGMSFWKRRRVAEFTASPAGATVFRRTAQRGVTKYNLAGDPQIDLPAGRRSILVPGQVEDDLSVRYGGGAIRTNLALLSEVRRDNPDAFILYKPHPDVLAGHRKGAVPDGEA